MHDPERSAWIALSMAAGIGPVRFQRLLEVCGGVCAAWQASDLEMATAGLERRTAESLRSLRSTTTPDQIMTRLHQSGINALTLLDEAYPRLLRDVADAPPVLFLRGALGHQDDDAVALVGTRRASPYGIAVAERLATDLARAGVTVVSGLAKGIDTAAHRAALDAGGRTIAVLGNGLNRIYPASNGTLAQRIIDSAGGAVVSEFAPSVPPDAANFPRRNRIIAGLAQATVIIEAPERSGALITADFSLEQGRDVLAVPGSIFSPNCAGPNELLKQGAIPVTSAEDILAAIGQPVSSHTVARAVPELGPGENSVWEALAGDPQHVDELARSLGQGAGDVSATLAVLELRGLARQVGAMLYTRA